MLSEVCLPCLHVCAFTHFSMPLSVVAAFTFSLDFDTVCILVRGDEKSPPLLAGLPKDVTEAILRDPLSCLRSTNIVELLRAAIGSAIGLNACKLMEAQGHMEDPLSRQLAIGYIPLGCHKTHIKFADYVIAKLFTGGKALGNRDLFFAVFVIVALQLPHDSDAIPSLLAQMKFRLEHHFTYSSLNGLPQYPNVRISLQNAIWFVLLSSRIIMDPHFVPYRTHAPAMNSLIFLNELAESPLDEKTMFMLRFTRNFLALLGFYKSDPTLAVTLTNALLQPHFITRNNIHLFFDGQISEKQQQEGFVRFCEKCPAAKSLTVRELVYTMRLFNPSVAAGDIVTHLCFFLSGSSQFLIHNACVLL